MLKDRECMIRYEESIEAHQKSEAEELMCLPRFPTEQQLDALSERLKAYPEVVLPPVHRFSNGVYIRELEIPAGCVVVGATHKHEHQVMLIEGACRINTDMGMEDIVAPHIWTSKPNDRRALYTYEHCTFITVHENPDNCQDIEELESRIVYQKTQLFQERRGQWLSQQQPPQS